MKTPLLSILIPSFNRAQKLDTCLKCLYEQGIKQNDFEIIVGDDGSTDGTEKILNKWSKKENFHFFSQKNSGQAEARNKALKKAKGELILFLGDDIYAGKNFLKRHLDFHKAHPQENEACLGLTKWYKEEKVSPFMFWLTHGGPQFAYSKLKAGQEASFWFFYTSNISLKRKILQRNNFDTDFKAYGWEDIELGYRLSKQGLKLSYEPKALAYHDHFMEESSLKTRMLNIGRSAVLFQKKQPELKVLPSGLKKILLFTASRLVFLAPLWFLKKISPKHFGKYYWTLASKRYFLQGIKAV